jgi:hypothetical protein
VLDRTSHEVLVKEIAEQIVTDQEVLSELRTEIRVLKVGVARIQPRETAAVSIVAADGGNNQLRFDPFLVQLVRVVDSNDNEYCLEVVSPTTKLAALNARQLDSKGSPQTALGLLMKELGIHDLCQLSHMIQDDSDGAPRSPSWVQVYRELVEWAILYSVMRKDFASDTLIVFDGLLRSKVFAQDFFARYRRLLTREIERHAQSRRRIYLVGLAKSSKVLSRYRLATALERILRTPYPAFVEIPREIEERAYIWSEYARGEDRQLAGGEINKFVMGKMFFENSAPAQPIQSGPLTYCKISQRMPVAYLASCSPTPLTGFPCRYTQGRCRRHTNMLRWWTLTWRFFKTAFSPACDGRSVKSRRY